MVVNSKWQIDFFFDDNLLILQNIGFLNVDSVGVFFYNAMVITVETKYSASH